MSPDHFTTRVAGVSFSPNYPTNLHRLEAAALSHFSDLDHYEPMPAVLEREPDNPHDPQAVAVHVPAVGMIGHLPAAVAAKLAPRLDDGETWQAGVSSVVVHPDHPERPGIELRIERVAEMRREGAS